MILDGMKTKLLLRCFQSPGDVVMLTAAIRDLHRAAPGRYVTDVRTPCPDLWRHNPYLTRLEDDQSGVETIECHYPLVHVSNREPFHFIHGYMQFLGEKLGIQIRPTEFRGDIHLSREERLTPPPFIQSLRGDLPVWIVAAGGKYDFTTKWWHRRRYQQVVDALIDQVQFVQVGESGHYHPPLRNACDLRGRTSLRDLVRLVYHTDGVLCGVTLLMHLAAAVPLRDGQYSRPAVVIAGGREAPHWEAYPTHQFLHTVGILPCCADGGCWKARTVPLGDGDEKDRPEQLCVDVVGGMPHCMHLITAESVTKIIAAIAAQQITANGPYPRPRPVTHRISRPKSFA